MARNRQQAQLATSLTITAIEPVWAANPLLEGAMAEQTLLVAGLRSLFALTP